METEREITNCKRYPNETVIVTYTPVQMALGVIGREATEVKCPQYFGKNGKFEHYCDRNHNNCSFLEKRD